MTYRDDAKQVHKDAGWTFFKFLPLFLLVMVTLTGLGFVTRSLGLWGSTAVERKVFEQSYQRSSALKARMASEEANIAELEAQLANPNLDQNTRHNLEAQARAARVRLNTARRQQ